MTYLGYILAAYLATALVLGALTAWVVLDLWAQKEKLRRLEAEGLSRGSKVGR